VIHAKRESIAKVVKKQFADNAQSVVSTIIVEYMFAKLVLIKKIIRPIFSSILANYAINFYVDIIMKRHGVIFAKMEIANFANKILIKKINMQSAQFVKIMYAKI